MAGFDGTAGGVKDMIHFRFSWSGFEAGDRGVCLEVEFVGFDQLLEDECYKLIRPETGRCGGQRSCWGAIDSIFSKRGFVIDEAHLLA